MALVALGSHQIGLQSLQEVTPENASFRLHLGFCFLGRRLHLHLLLLDLLLQLHGFFGHKSDALVDVLHELLRADFFLRLAWRTWR